MQRLIIDQVSDDPGVLLILDEALYEQSLSFRFCGLPYAHHDPRTALGSVSDVLLRVMLLKTP
jgi:hypothetical protein